MLKQRQIFIFWIPLALSWFLMTFEHPWVQGVIGRLPDAKLQLAAFGLILSIMILIETPIIMMLGTSATLSRNRQHYRILWRYLMIVNGLITIIGILMGFTPLLDWWLGTVVGVESHITEAVRPGIQVMVLWPAFVGYRRFHQGVMIRNNHTSPIGYGTLVRLITGAGTAIALGMLTPIPGATVGAAAMLASAFVEMVYVIIVGRQDVRTVVATELKANDTPLTYLHTFRFHLPLAATSLMTLLVRPVIERGLATTPNAEAALAAWAVIFSMTLIARSGAMAWQEGVISLSETPGSLPALRRFTWVIGFALTIILALIAFTPLATLYLDNALRVPVEVQPLVLMGIRFGILIPILTAFQSYYRGLLMHIDHTTPIYSAMFVSFAVTTVVMFGGIAIGLEGVVAGTLSLVLGYIGEVIVLGWSLRRQPIASQPVYRVAGENA